MAVDRLPSKHDREAMREGVLAYEQDMTVCRDAESSFIAMPRWDEYRITEEQARLARERIWSQKRGGNGGAA